MSRYAIFYMSTAGTLVLVCLGRSSQEVKASYRDCLPDIDLKQVKSFILKTFIEHHAGAGYWRVVQTWKAGAVC